MLTGFRTRKSTTLPLDHPVNFKSIYLTRSEKIDFQEETKHETTLVVYYELFL